MPDIGVALVGYGYAGKTIHAPLIRAAKGLHLRTVVSSRPDDVHADLPDVIVCDLEAALADPAIGLVVVATPNDLHAPQAHAALDAGKSVVVDKPFALDVVQAQTLIDHAKRVNKTLSIFHCRRWDSNYLTFQSLRDRLGDIYQFILRYDRWRPVVRDRWRERPGPGSGIWYDLGSHLLDQSLSLFGWPEWIEADIAAQRPGAQTDDYFHVTLGYGPWRVILHSSMLTAAPGACLEAQGSTGAFVKFGMDTQEDMLKAQIVPGSSGWGRDKIAGSFTPISDDAPGQPEAIATIPGNYLAYYEQMAIALNTNAPPPVPAEDALKVMQLLAIGADSAGQGRRLSV